ncbi:hypothetical protein ANTQUA_LOCUS2471 [Anthophora quadrimaculata]
MTTLKKDEKRASKKSKKSSQKTVKRVNSTKNDRSKADAEELNEDPLNFEFDTASLDEAENVARTSGRFERTSIRKKIGLLIRSSVELPAAINRGLQPIRRSLSFNKDLNRLQEPPKPHRTGSSQWYNSSLVSLAEDECLDDLDIAPHRNSTTEELLSPKVHVTRTQSLIDITFVRSPRRRVKDLLRKTAPYGRHSEHYDSSIDLSNPPFQATSLPALAHTATEDSYTEAKSPREREQQVRNEWRNSKSLVRPLSLLYIGQLHSKHHSVSVKQTVQFVREVIRLLSDEKNLTLAL